MRSGMGRGARAEGVVVRHRRSCASRAGGGCDCGPGFQAQVFVARDGRTVRKTFRSLAEARAWRAQTSVAMRQGTFAVPTRTTLREVAEAWLAGAGAGVVRTRSGDRYKPSALRAYRASLDARVLPQLGALRLSAVTRPQVQELVDRLVAEGLSASTVRNTVLPLRAIFRRARARAEVTQNPTLGLTLPAVRGRRERVARPDEAIALLRALGPDDRAIYATALYAGLRRGELCALRWEDVDLNRNLISVERAWDPCAGLIEPKSRAGRRRVPIAAPLRSELIAHRLRQGAGGDGLVFPNRRGQPFSSGWIAERASAAWRKADLKPIGLHECRHTYAAFMIAAGVNAKALSTYMGHSSITITLDRYGHLMPGNEQQAADMLSTYLEHNRRTTHRRGTVR
jgi:integrase